MRPLTRRTWEAMSDLASQPLAPIPASSAPERISSGLHDPLMRGFALMVFQSPHLLACQRTRQQRRHRCPLATLCGGGAGPLAPQRRDMLDAVPVALLRALGPGVFEKIRRAGWANDFPPPGLQRCSPRRFLSPEARWERLFSCHPPAGPPGSAASGQGGSGACASPRGRGPAGPSGRAAGVALRCRRGAKR
jgi:hypothetical protein